jgi:hypothetical protein
MPKSLISFNLDREIIDQLLQLENRSLFLNNLLSEHFSTNTPIKAKYEEKLKEIDKLATEADKINEQLSIEEQQINREREIIEQKERDYENSDERWNKIRDQQRFALISRYQVPKEEVESILNDFMVLFQSKLIKNIVEYAELKQFPLKTRNIDTIWK